MAAPASTLLANTQAFQGTGTLAISIIIVCVHRDIQDQNAKVCFVSCWVITMKSKQTNLKNQVTKSDKQLLRKLPNGSNLVV